MVSSLRSSAQLSIAECSRGKTIHDHMVVFSMLLHVAAYLCKWHRPGGKIARRVEEAADAHGDKRERQAKSTRMSICTNSVKPLQGLQLLSQEGPGAPFPFRITCLSGWPVYIFCFCCLISAWSSLFRWRAVAASSPSSISPAAWTARVKMTANSAELRPKS